MSQPVLVLLRDFRRHWVPQSVENEDLSVNHQHNVVLYRESTELDLLNQVVILVEELCRPAAQVGDAKDREMDRLLTLPYLLLSFES